MIVNLLALIVIAACAVHGFIRGLTATLLALLGMAVAFLATWLFCGLAARCLRASFRMPLLFACVLGAVLVFVIACGVFALFVQWVRRRKKDKKPAAAASAEYPWADKLLGACLGAGFGILAAGSLIWLYSLASLTPAGAAWPDIRASAAARLAGFIIRPEAYLLARSAVSDPALAGSLARDMSDPRTAAENLQRIAKNPQLAELQQDNPFARAVLRADKQAIQNNPRLKHLLADSEFVRSARELGMLPPESETVSTVEQAADQLVRVGRNVDRIRADPEVQDILRDGQVAKMLNDQDFDQLMRDDRAQRLAVRVMQIMKSD